MPTALDPRSDQEIAESINRDYEQQNQWRIQRAPDFEADKAAKAAGIAEDTGIDPIDAARNLDEVAKAHKQNLTHNIIHFDPNLQSYLESHPLAASVSQNDWHNLSDFSDFMKKAYGPGLEVLKSTPGGRMLSDPKQVFSDTWDIAKSGFRQLVEAAKPGITPETEEIVQTTIKKWQEQGIDPKVIERQADLLRKQLGRGEMVQALFAPAQIAISPILGAGRTAVTRPLAEYLGVPIDTVEGYAMVLLALAGVKGARDLAKADPAKVGQVADKVEPFVKAEENVPVGVDPLIDEGKAREAQLDAQHFDDIESAADRSETREISPEIFQNLPRIIAKDAKIGIPYDAIRRIYGDKEPSPEDNLLGRVPDILQKIRSAASTGGDVEIPVHDWVTWVDKEIRKALADDRRVRSSGLTKAEVESKKETAELQDKHLENLDDLAEFRRKEFDKTVFDPAREAEKDQAYQDWQEAKAERDEYARRIGKEPPTPKPPEAEDPYDTVQRAAGLKPIPGILLTPREYFEKGPKGIFGVEPATEDIALPGITKEGMLERTRPLGSTTLERALNEIQINKVQDSISNLYKALAKRIKEISGEVPVHIVSNEEWYKTSLRLEQGAYYDSIRNHVVISEYDYMGGDPRGLRWIMLHESIHAITTRAIYRNPSSGALAKGVRDLVAEANPELIKKFAYFMEDEHEFIAGIFDRDFQQALIDTPLNARIAERLNMKEWRGKTMWQAAVEFIRRVLGLPEEDTNALEVALMAFDRITEDQKNMFGPRGIEAPKAVPERKAPPKLGVQEAKAVGVTKDMLARWEKLVKAGELRKSQKILERAHKLEMRRMSKEWRDNLPVVEAEERDLLMQRPEIAAMDFMRNGVYLGKKIGAPPKLNRDALSKDQQGGLPDTFMKKGGMDPDEMAGMFGFETGDEFVQNLIAVSQRQGRIPFRNYIQSLVDEQVASRMANEFGVPAKDILDGLRQDILHPSELDRLAEETYLFGQKAGVAQPFMKEDFQRMADAALNDKLMKDISTEKSLRESGKAGREIEKEMLKQKWDSAYEWAQRRQIAALQAKETMKLEKMRNNVERIMKRFSKTAVPGVSQEYVPFMQEIVMRLEGKIDIDPVNLQKNMELTKFKTLNDFIDHKLANRRNIQIPDWLLDSKEMRNIDEMTVEDFRDIHDSLKSLEWNARMDGKIFKGQQVVDLDETIERMVEKIEDVLPPMQPKHFPSKFLPKGVAATSERAVALWNQVRVAHLTAESIMNRLDRGNIRGDFNQFVVRPMAQAADNEHLMLREYQAKLRAAVGKIPGANKKIKNGLIKEGIFSDENLPLRKRQVLGILSIYGDPVARDKFIKSQPGMTEQSLAAWLFDPKRGITKEDLDRQQKIGDLLEELFRKGDRMSYETGGVPIKKNPIEPLTTPYGTYRGWHHPIDYQKFGPDREPITEEKILANTVNQPGFKPITTNRGWTKERTTFVGDQELDLDIIPQRMKEMIHDINFRPAILQAQKILWREDLQKAMLKHLGREEVNWMKEWVRDVANANNQVNLGLFGRVIEGIRQNTIGTLIGFNLNVVAKHSLTAGINSLQQVGPLNFLREVAHIWGKSDEVGKTNWRFAMDNSGELDRRTKTWTEYSQGQAPMHLLRSSPRQAMLALGGQMVGFFDLATAVPTWNAAYRKALRAGETVEDAKYIADTSVRQAHGSSAVTNWPKVASSRNPIIKSYGSLYNFFSHIGQKQYEMAWRAKDARYEWKKGDVQDAKQLVKPLPFMFLSYIAGVAAVEELVTPLWDDESKSWGEKAARGLAATAFSMTSSWIAVRSFMRDFFWGREGQQSIFDTSEKLVLESVKDIVDWAQGKPWTGERSAKALKNFIITFGVLTGLTNQTEAKAAQYLYRYYHNMEHPSGVGDWLHGLKEGTGKPKPLRRRHR
jgi:hypothetical protein